MPTCEPKSSLGAVSGGTKSRRELGLSPVRLVVGSIISVARPVILWPWAARRWRMAAGAKNSDVEPRAPGERVSPARRRQLEFLARCDLLTTVRSHWRCGDALHLPSTTHHHATIGHF